MNIFSNTVDDLVRIMRETVVKFTYKKKNREERIAYGTLSADIIGTYGPSKGTRQKASGSGTVSYFDITVLGWRSFIPANFIGIDPDYSM